MSLVTPLEAFDTPSTHLATPSGMAAAAGGGGGAPGQRLAAG